MRSADWQSDHLQDYADEKFCQGIISIKCELLHQKVPGFRAALLGSWQFHLLTPCCGLCLAELLMIVNCWGISRVRRSTVLLRFNTKDWPTSEFKQWVNELIGTDLVLVGETLVGKHSGKIFLVVDHQVCKHLRRDFGRLLFTETLSSLGFLAAASHIKVSAPSTYYL